MHGSTPPNAGMIVKPGPLFRRRLPKLDRIAFWIVDACEAARFRRVPFGIFQDRDPGRGEFFHERVESGDVKVQHPLLFRRKVMGRLRDGRDDGRPGRLVPLEVDAEVLLVPRRERVRIIRPEKEAADTRYWRRSPQLLLIATSNTMIPVTTPTQGPTQRREYESGKISAVFATKRYYQHYYWVSRMAHSLDFPRFGGHSVKPVEDGRRSVQCQRKPNRSLR